MAEQHPLVEVLVIDDEETAKILARTAFEAALFPHVYREASTMDESRALLSQMAEEPSAPIQVVCLDGNLTKGVYDGNDGRHLFDVVQTLRRTHASFHPHVFNTSNSDRTELGVPIRAAYDIGKLALSDLPDRLIDLGIVNVSTQ